MTPSTRNNSVKNNKLNSQQQFKLNKWVADNELNMKGKPRPVLAEVAAVELGFPVTPFNICGAELATDIRLSPTRAGFLAAESGVDRVQDMARITLALFKKLGEPVPARLHALAGTPVKSR